MDSFFIGWFLIHIATTLLVDIQPLLPSWVYPKAIRDIVIWYIDVAGDKMMRGAFTGEKDLCNGHYWFRSLVTFELFYQLPMFFYIINGLRQGGVAKARMELPALIYCAHVVTTLIPINAEVLFSPNFRELSLYQKTFLMTAYTPFWVVPLLFGIQCFQNIRSREFTRQKSL
jgi:hypothetical protein